jgi:hypothetical protein
MSASPIVRQDQPPGSIVSALYSLALMFPVMGGTALVCYLLAAHGFAALRIRIR